MDHPSDRGREPYREPSWGAYSSAPPRYQYHQQPSQQLSHQPSGISMMSNIENPYDPADSRHLRGRESIVSIDSAYSRWDAAPDAGGNATYATYLPSSHGPPWPSPFSPCPYSSPAGGGYSPVSASNGGPPHRSWSKASRRQSNYASEKKTVPESIREDELYDLSLLGSAAPMGAAPGPRPYDVIREEDEENHSVPAFDLTATLGPMTSHDEHFIRKLQEQEAKGTLTGGLGQGFRPGTRVRSGDLLASPVSVERSSLARSFSRRVPSRRLSRAETLRYMGQDEANRRGEVIEVIMEEPAAADLSNIEGPDTLVSDDERRRSTCLSKEPMTQVFYPQPNWKPFSMQWPYLTMLILVSLGLAVMQEVLFRFYKQTPLIRFMSPNDVEPGLYFAVKFAPTICAVVYGVLWQFTDFKVRRLEAFYQLSKKGGASAAESINIDYATSINYFRPFRALKRGHYAVALSSVATNLAAGLVPTFAAASVVLKPSQAERLANPDGYKTLNFDPIWSRLLSTTLVMCAALGCGLFYLLQTRRSGLLSDVRGIAGLASMAVVSHILMDFKDMDTAKHDDIHHRLKYNRYVLRNSSIAPDDESPTSAKERDIFEDHNLPSHPHPMMLRPVGIVSMMVGLLLFTGLIPAFLFSSASIVTDKAPWVVTAMAVSLKMAWGGMETAVCMMEPYYILSRRHAPSKTLLLDYTALPFGYMPVRALLNGHLLVFLVGFGSVMAQFLTILVTGLATVDGHDFLKEYSSSTGNSASQINSGQETVQSFYVSVGLSLFILVYMSAVATAVFVGRRHPFLPRQPSTIASVLAYMHQSKMLWDFVGTEKFSKAQMLGRLGEGKTYGLGWFEGRDGQKHCGVDQEELISNYKHGIDFLQGIQPWNTRWDVL